jgi:hypothetical protein
MCRASVKVLAGSILGSTKVLKAAEKELAYVRKNKLRVLFYLDAEFPATAAPLRRRAGAACIVKRQRGTGP